MGISASGAKTAAAMFTASAHNVANLNSEDVHPVSVESVAQPSAAGGALPLSRVSPIAQPVDLVGEIVTLQVAAAAYRANMAVWRAGDELAYATLDELA